MCRAGLPSLAEQAGGEFDPRLDGTRFGRKHSAVSSNSTASVGSGGLAAGRRRTGRMSRGEVGIIVLKRIND